MRPDMGAVRLTFTTLESPVGVLLLLSDGEALTGLFPASHRSLPDTAGLKRDDALFSGIRDQLNAYFRGKLSEFKVPLKPQGTEFQKQVWQELEKLPLGATRTYQEIANAVGRPSASRAIGAAVGKNPISIIVPCHRVVGGSGLTGYAGGLAMKRWLLAHEAAMVPWRVQVAVPTAPGVAASRA